MDEDQVTDSSGADLSESRPQRRGFVVTLAALLVIGLGILGAAYIQLQEQHEATLATLTMVERELSHCEANVDQLESDLAEESDRLRSCRSELDVVTASLSDALSTIRGVESSLGHCKDRNADLAVQIDDLSSQVDQWSSRYRSCAESLQDAESDALLWNREAVRLAAELDECVDIANDRLRRINACIDSVNTGIIWVTDIPPEGFTLSFGDPYEELRQKYNDLVGRFNAAIDRCNDLSSLLSRSLKELE